MSTSLLPNGLANVWHLKTSVPAGTLKGPIVSVTVVASVMEPESAGGVTEAGPVPLEPQPSAVARARLKTTLSKRMTGVSLVVDDVDDAILARAGTAAVS